MEELARDAEREAAHHRSLKRVEASGNRRDEAEQHSGQPECRRDLTACAEQQDRDRSGEHTADGERDRDHAVGSHAEESSRRKVLRSGAHLEADGGLGQEE